MPYNSILPRILVGKVIVQEKNGELVLSRDTKRINNSQDAQAILVGTYSIAGNRAFLSTRLVSTLDNTILSSYNFSIRINWLPEYHEESVIDLLMEIKEIESKKTVLRTKAVDLPRRLWTNLVRASGIVPEMTWADVSKERLQKLALQLTRSEFKVEGKSTFKEEFVTAGGVNLKEINFKTFESKLQPNLFFAGEIINVDAITGGFNFQNAWTGGYMAAQGIIDSI